MITLISTDNSVLINKLPSCEWNLRINPDKLVFELFVEDTNTVSLNGDGTSSSYLNASVKISSYVGNKIVVKQDGLYVASVDGVSQTLSYDPDTRILSLGPDGNSVTLSAPPASQTLSFNSSTYDLTISDGNTVSLVALHDVFTETPLSVTDTNTIDFSTSGTANHTLTGSVRVDNTTTNLITVSSNGLRVAPVTPTNTPLTANSSTTIAFATSGVDNHTLTGSVNISEVSGNVLIQEMDGLYVPTPTFTETPITANDSTTIDFTTSGSGNHTITAAVKISLTGGNIISSNSDGIYASAPYTVSGTTNYVAKFTSANSVGNSLIYDDGSKVVVNGTTGSSKFNVIGTSEFNFTQIYTGGPSYGAVFSYTPTYTGTLPTTNASFSTIPVVFSPIFNGNTTVGSDTLFGSVLLNNYSSFSSTGTVTVNGNNSASVAHISTFDAGTVNGTINRSSGISINGIFLVAGSTATITRTTHYQLLINDINQYGYGGNVTNRFAIYTAGASDNIRFGSLGTGTVTATAGVLSVTSDGRLKNDFGEYGNALEALELLPNGKYFTWKSESTMPIDIKSFTLFADEVHNVLGEVFAPTQPNGYYGLNDRALLSLAIQAIKELSAEVKELKVQA